MGEGDPAMAKGAASSARIPGPSWDSSFEFQEPEALDTRNFSKLATSGTGTWDLGSGNYTGNLR
jgi:hypothetical protein